MTDALSGDGDIINGSVLEKDTKCITEKVWRDPLVYRPQLSNTQSERYNTAWMTWIHSQISSTSPKMQDYSRRFERRERSFTTVVNHLKTISAEFGTQQTFTSDNGPYNSSQKFSFASWPTYPQNDRFVKRVLQTIKGTLRLLTYRSTPIDKECPALGKLLNQREYRILLTFYSQLQRIQNHYSNTERLQSRQNSQKEQDHQKIMQRLQQANSQTKLSAKTKIMDYQPKLNYQPKSIISQN